MVTYVKIVWIPILLSVFVRGVICWLVAYCLSQEGICLDKCTCCLTEKDVADPTCHLTKSQYTVTES